MTLYPCAIMRAAWTLLPDVMCSPAAEQILLAIGWQESRWRWRRQRGGGRARGYYQFEVAGVEGVLRHARSRLLALETLTVLGYRYTSVEATAPIVWAAIEHHDVLATVWARLLLWTDPDPLPGHIETAWTVYLRLWRPGRPRRETWSEAWAWAERIMQARDTMRAG